MYFDGLTTYFQATKSPLAMESTRQVHMLFSAETKTDISKFINANKSASSRIVKKGFP
jgi:hypothetical protein